MKVYTGTVTQIDHAWGLGKILRNDTFEVYLFDTTCKQFMQLKQGDIVTFEPAGFNGWYTCKNVVKQSPSCESQNDTLCVKII